jgi:hypothetical protein
MAINGGYSAFSNDAEGESGGGGGSSSSSSSLNRGVTAQVSTARALGMRPSSPTKHSEESSSREFRNEKTQRGMTIRHNRKSGAVSSRFHYGE